MSAPLTDEGTTRFVETPSWKLKYNEAGEGHPVILLHGSGAGATGWSNFAPNIAALAAALPGARARRTRAGASPTPRRPTPTTTPPRSWSSWTPSASRRPPWSATRWAGMTAITFAARYPDRISHLITMGPGSFFSVPAMFGPGDGPSEGLKILQEGYRNPTPEVMKRLVEIMTFSSEHATDELAQQRADNAAARPDHLANFLESFARRGPVPTAATPQEITSITTKALLIHGRDDRVVHFEHSLRLVSMIADSRLVLLNRCGHWAQLEHAAGVQPPGALVHHRQLSRPTATAPDHDGRGPLSSAPGRPRQAARSREIAAAVRCTRGAAASGLKPIALPDIEIAPTARPSTRIGAAVQTRPSTTSSRSCATPSACTRRSCLEEAGGVGDRVAGAPLEALRPGPRRSPRAR